MNQGTSIIELLSSLTRKLFRRLSHFVDDSGLSTHDALVLWKVRVRSSCRTNEISDGTALAPSTLTGIIDRLEAKGFIRRVSDPDDRRATLIAITDDGESLVTTMLAQAEGEVDKIFKNFGEERLAFIRSEILAMLEELESAEVEA